MSWKLENISTKKDRAAESFNIFLTFGNNTAAKIHASFIVQTGMTAQEITNKAADALKGI